MRLHGRSSRGVPQSPQRRVQLTRRGVAGLVCGQLLVRKWRGQRRDALQIPLLYREPVNVNGGYVLCINGRYAVYCKRRRYAGYCIRRRYAVYGTQRRYAVYRKRLRWVAVAGCYLR